MRGPRDVSAFLVRSRREDVLAAPLFAPATAGPAESGRPAPVTGDLLALEVDRGVQEKLAVREHRGLLLSGDRICCFDVLILWL